MSLVFAVKKSVVFIALLVTFHGGSAFAQNPSLSLRQQGNPLSRSHSGAIAGSGAVSVSVSGSISAANRQVEFVCSGNDVPPGFPMRVRFKILSSAQIEASGFDRADNQTPSSLMRRSERPNSPGAVFMMGGLLGVSGNATLSIAPTALEMGEVGTILIQNQSTIESVVYLCSKIL